MSATKHGLTSQCTTVLLHCCFCYCCRFDGCYIPFNTGYCPWLPTTWDHLGPVSEADKLTMLKAISVSECVERVWNTWRTRWINRKKGEGVVGINFSTVKLLRKQHPMKKEHIILNWWSLENTNDRVHRQEPTEATRIYRWMDTYLGKLKHSMKIRMQKWD